MIDFIIIDLNDKSSNLKNNYFDYVIRVLFIVIEDQCNQCEQLCFPNSINQTEIVCSCAQQYTLVDDGRSCKSQCTEYVI